MTEEEFKSLEIGDRIVAETGFNFWSGPERVLIRQMSLGGYFIIDRVEKNEVWVDKRILNETITFNVLECPHLKLWREEENMYSGAITEAVKANDLETVKFLVRKGAKLQSYHLSEAIEKNNLVIASYLIEQGVNDEGNCLFNALYTGNIKAVEMLIQSGIRFPKGSVFRSGTKAQDNLLKIIEFLIEKAYPVVKEEKKVVEEESKGPNFLVDL
jgi:hypothetical protein